jgi:hypothetical protein
MQMGDQGTLGTELCALAEEWFMHRPISAKMSKSFATPVEVPDELLVGITSVEPYRSRVVEDARQYLAIPQFTGIGLTIETENPTEAPFGAWKRCVSPFTFWASWNVLMDGSQTESRKEEWDLVVFEDGRWKIASLLTDATRDQNRSEIDMIRNHAAD